MGVGATGPTGPVGQFVAVKAFSGGLQLSAGDVTRILRFSSNATGNVALSLPVGVSQGWTTGTVSNENMTYTVTVGVPAGTSLDGVSNGTQTILPLQRCSFYYDTDGWHTVWVDRTPLVVSKNITTGVAQLDWGVPLGYNAFEFVINKYISSAGGSLTMYISNNGGATFRTGTTGDYYYNRMYMYSSATAPTLDQGNSTGLLLIGGVSAGGGGLGGGGAMGIIEPGIFTVQSYCYDQSTNNYQMSITCVQNNAQGNALLTNINYARIQSVSGGTFTGYVSIRAIP